MRIRLVNPLSAPARHAACAFAAAFALAVAAIPCVSAQAAPAAPSPGQSAAAAPPSPAPAAESRTCRNAKSKVARAQRSVDKVEKAIARARAGSTTCTTKPVCDRYATKIEELEARRVHRASLLTRSMTTADAACKGS